jgi:hypothetical protein
MALTHNSLGPPVYIPAVAGAVITNAAGRKTTVRGLILFNGNTQTETVKLYFVPNSAGEPGVAVDAGSVGGNQWFEMPLQAKEPLMVEIVGPGLVLDGTNDTIQAATTTASKVTLTPVGDYET